MALINKTTTKVINLVVVITNKINTKKKIKRKVKTKRKIKTIKRKVKIKRRKKIKKVMKINSRRMNVTKVYNTCRKTYRSQNP